MFLSFAGESLMKISLTESKVMSTENIADVFNKKPSGRASRGFGIVRPAGRTDLVVQVHYSPGKGKS